MQTDNTKDLLKAAVARQHGQDKVVCGVADLWIDSGLCERSCGSFELQSVPLRSMKPGLLHLKQKLGLKNPLTQIVHMPAVQKHFTVTEQISGRKVLTANLLTLLPNPSPAVKSALASVQWSQSAAHSEARTLPMSSTTADSDAPSSTSSSQCITYKAQSQPQEIVPLATPIAAVMVDAQLSQSAGLLHKLHWIQVPNHSSVSLMSCVTYMHACMPV